MSGFATLSPHFQIGADCLHTPRTILCILSSWRWHFHNRFVCNSLDYAHRHQALTRIVFLASTFDATLPLYARDITMFLPSRPAAPPLYSSCLGLPTVLTLWNASAFRNIPETLSLLQPSNIFQKNPIRFPFSRAAATRS